MLAVVHGAELGWRSEGLGLCKNPRLECKEKHWGADLERRDVGVGHVAVHILDLGEVLLRHMHKLRGAHLIGESREALVKRWWVVLLIVVLLRVEREAKQRVDSKGRRKVIRSAD